ncbi:acyl-[acyl-carrier-protein]--UDP-N-acetylglucosamine O-acyltransferase [Tamaricihabitans halophyticus]|uniref:Acyl-[acyl-carrier-protein]--UDP-N-acetylglucosamine O-acyltransferase n=1 Tax=Tamaricihabitans halophyticus TaxID=1262583 RepID=A0A4R2R3C7_9PSEU|nr:UDP-N-acetylglucosamine acyltransferase [Tamaricihabitans halophyticus]TCP57063.1 acyl-[acyl-carrier-protein]--UDP-N-acetylglucosamine O-acyltransferase [Tamaricihabitans halophyticus]
MTNQIHPTAVVGAGVEMGTGNVIGPYTVIVGPVVLGDDNWIGPHVTIGTPAEDRGGPHPAGWADAPTGAATEDGAGVRIGNRNRIREYVSVHQGTWRETWIGHDCYLLRGSHTGHDVRLDDRVTLACAVQLGGHTHVWADANLGMNTTVHQHGRIGPGAMVGMSAAVRGEVGAFTIAVGNPARVSGINEVGLRRKGCDEATIEALGPFLKGKQARPEAELAGDAGELGTLLVEWAARSPLND